MGTDPNEPGELTALTIMYKVDGFNAEANDWFWVKAAGDGSAIDAEKHVLLGTRKWQSNGHSRALARGALRPDSPAVGIGDSLSDGQAQARTLR